MNVNVPPAVRVIETGDGGVLLHAETKAAIQLDTDQMEMWRALSKSDSIEAARSFLAGLARVDEPALTTRLGTFVTALLERGLIEVGGGYVSRLRLQWWQYGPAEALRHSAVALKEHLGWWLDAGFDRRHGTDTTGHVPVNGLRATGSSVAHAFYYVPTPARVFRDALARAVSHPEQKVFVDFGSGKGRTLLLASHTPFRRIIGIEFSQSLHAIAQCNILAYRARGQRCAEITSVLCDATEFELPNEDLVLYFWTPFRGPVLERVLERIETSFSLHSRALTIILYAARDDFIQPFRNLRCVSERLNVRPPHSGLGSSTLRLFVFSNAQADEAVPGGGMLAR